MGMTHWLVNQLGLQPIINRVMGMQVMTLYQVHWFSAVRVMTQLIATELASDALVKQVMTL